MKETTGLWKKAAAIALLAVSLSFGTVYAEDNLKTVYHVYVGDKHIGIVDDKETAEEKVQQNLDEEQAKHEEYDVELLEDVSYVPEKIFSPSHDSKETVRELEESIEVGVSAVELTVDDETAAFLPSEQEAEEAVRSYKEQYVDAEDLKEAEARDENEEPEIKDKTIVDVELSKDVEQTEKIIEASDMNDIEEAVEILQNGKNKEKIHKVEDGEVLGEIASQYDLSEDKLLELNEELEEEEPLQIDQEVTVTDTEPLTEVLIKEEGIKKEKIPHETEVVETDDLLKGEKETKQEGKDGEKEVHYYKDKRNDRTTDEGTIEEKELSEPKKEIVLKGTKEIPSKGTGDFEWPAVGGTITSKQGERWGSHHKGIDIAGVSDRTIKAADNGKVIEAEKSGAYGNKVVVDHNNGYETTYAHLKSMDVKVGDTVEKGSSLGVMGTTGRSTGVHLHFELHKNGSLENPLDHVQQ
ncbi:peptidoglycan DD-metalloendopeptidase family protein [Halobacillus sp. Marseille-P3879]|uniref:peptidoglycan DD-metalloendopeptidase family protein n=1 Tax=Halobacillus sp. Marseille-P3879 TaxID=2045014 RepID=UPI000C7BD03F|nr:peptidoglycan DD-metalloendopeptidase family protein [Halobacillus sp. Marseille-P3879]